MQLICKCGMQRQLWSNHNIASGYTLHSNGMLVHKPTYAGYVNDPAAINAVLLCPKCMMAIEVQLVKINSHYEIREKK